MTGDYLKLANEIQKEIKELEGFIFSAERAWTGKIIKRKANFIFKSNGYGPLSAAEYNMDTEMKNRVLGVLKERLQELKDQLKSL